MTMGIVTYVANLNTSRIPFFRPTPDILDILSLSSKHSSCPPFFQASLLQCISLLFFAFVLLLLASFFSLLLAHNDTSKNESLLSPGQEPESQKRIGGGWALKSRKSLNGVSYPIVKRGARSNFWKIWQREVRLLILAHLSSWKISSFPTYPLENHLMPNISSTPQYRQLESTLGEMALHQRQFFSTVARRSS